LFPGQWGGKERQGANKKEKVGTRERGDNQRDSNALQRELRKEKSPEERAGRGRLSLKTLYTIQGDVFATAGMWGGP